MENRNFHYLIQNLPQRDFILKYPILCKLKTLDLLDIITKLERAYSKHIIQSATNDYDKYKGLQENGNVLVCKGFLLKANNTNHNSQDLFQINPRR